MSQEYIHVTILMNHDGFFKNTSLSKYSIALTMKYAFSRNRLGTLNSLIISKIFVRTKSCEFDEIKQLVFWLKYE
jgi:hypothetical protein